MFKTAGIFKTRTNIYSKKIEHFSYKLIFCNININIEKIKSKVKSI